MDRKIKIIILMSYLLIIFSLVELAFKQVSGYDSSIYSGQNIFIWIALYMSVAICILMIISLGFSKRNNSDIILFFCFMALIFSNILVISFGYLSGYAFYGRHDALSHAGYAKSILNSGCFSIDNVYPIGHILISEISLISNIDIWGSVILLADFFYLLFILFIYLLSTSLFKERHLILIASVSSSFFILGKFFFESYYLTAIPNGMADFLVPLVLYLYLSKREYGFRTLLLILLILLPFFHPLTSFFLIIILSALEVYKYLFVKEDIKNNSLTPLLVIFVIFISWISTHILWDVALSRIFYWMYGEISGSAAVGLSSIFAKLDLPPLELGQMVIKIFLPTLIFLVLSSFAVIIVASNFNYYGSTIQQLCFAYLVIFLIIVLSFIIPMNFDLLRATNYVLIFSIILSPVALGNLYLKYGIKGELIIALLLIMSSISGISTVYNSPENLRPNQQITKMDLFGADWLFSKGNMDYDINAIMSIDYYRFADFILGTDKRRLLYKKQSEIIPDHFNYLNKSKEMDEYMSISKSDIILYTEVWPQAKRYNSIDFKRNDDITNKLYSNGESHIFIF